MRGGGWRGERGGGEGRGEGRGRVGRMERGEGGRGGERFIKAARKVVCNVRDLAIHCSGRIDV